MNGIAEVTLLGNVGQPPDIKTSPANLLIAKFSVAVNSARTDRSSGEKVKETTWVKCAAFGKTAEIIEKHVHRGDPIFIKGRLDVSRYETKDGEKRTDTKVIVDRLCLLPSGGGQGGEPQPWKQYGSPAEYAEARESGPSGDCQDYPLDFGEFEDGPYDANGSVPPYDSDVPF
jgi:single-strand DNA-binding protein